MRSVRSCCLVLTLASLLQPMLAQGTCKVTIEACVMPFDHDDGSHNSCIRNDDLQDHVCLWSNATTERKAWARCNGGCFDAGGVPIEFGGDMGSYFCKTKDSACVFPFNHDGETHHECVQDEGFSWCATSIDETGEMREGFWGKCDQEACKKDEEVVPVPQEQTAAKVAEVKIDQNGIVADLTFEQADDQSPLTIRGEISGLEPGMHGFHVHEHANDGDDCVAAGGHYNPFNQDHGGSDSEPHHVGDLGNVEADSDGRASVDLSVTHASLFGSERNVVGRTLVIHAGQDDLGQAGDEGSRLTGNSGGRLACAVIREAGQGLFGIPWLTLVILIVLIVVIVLLLILICCLICFCCKKRRSKSKIARDDPDNAPFQNGDTRKKPLYDELSIPFIDASPTPTPKTGRSTERLSFFHRSSSMGRSRGSLSSEEK